MSRTVREGGLAPPSPVAVARRWPAVLRSPTLQGFILTAPLLFLFAAFVLYPMLSGLYAASDPDSLRRDVRRAVADTVGVTPSEVVVLEPGTVEKTTSGKLRRAAMRDAFVDGSLARR